MESEKRTNENLRRKLREQEEDKQKEVTQRKIVWAKDKEDQENKRKRQKFLFLLRSVRAVQPLHPHHARWQTVWRWSSTVPNSCLMADDSYSCDRRLWVRRVLMNILQQTIQWQCQWRCPLAAVAAHHHPECPEPTANTCAFTLGWRNQMKAEVSLLCNGVNCRSWFMSVSLYQLNPKPVNFVLAEPFV